MKTISTQDTAQHSPGFSNIYFITWHSDSHTVGLIEFDPQTCDLVFIVWAGSISTGSDDKIRHKASSSVWSLMDGVCPVHFTSQISRLVTIILILTHKLGQGQESEAQVLPILLKYSPMYFSPINNTFFLFCLKSRLPIVRLMEFEEKCFVIMFAKISSTPGNDSHQMGEQVLLSN